LATPTFSTVLDGARVSSSAFPTGIDSIEAVPDPVGVLTATVAAVASSTAPDAASAIAGSKPDRTVSRSVFQSVLMTQ
jgi:hypothetical protein